MPLAIAGIAVVGLVGKVLLDEFDDTVSRTGPNLVLLAAAGVGLWFLFKRAR